MREIEFRGKRVDNNKWVYGFYSQFHNRPVLDEPNSHQIFELLEEGIRFAGTSIGGLWRIINENTLGQYTGLKDKNGTKIFEGDILVFCKGATHPIKVYWDCLGWKFLRNGKRIEGAFECDISSHIRQCEIIGNIHDNPELLEVE